MSIHDLYRLREEYRKTPDSYAQEFRLSFAEVVIDRLRELGCDPTYDRADPW